MYLIKESMFTKLIIDILKYFNIILKFLIVIIVIHMTPLSYEHYFILLLFL